MSSSFQQTSFERSPAKRFLTGSEVTWGHGASAQQTTLDDAFTLFLADIAQAFSGAEALSQSSEVTYEPELISSTALGHVTALLQPMSSTPVPWDYTDEEFSALF